MTTKCVTLDFEKATRISELKIALDNHELCCDDIQMMASGIRALYEINDYHELCPMTGVYQAIQNTKYYGIHNCGYGVIRYRYTGIDKKLTYIKSTEWHEPYQRVVVDHGMGSINLHSQLHDLTVMNFFGILTLRDLETKHVNVHYSKAMVRILYSGESLIHMDAHDSVLAFDYSRRPSQHRLRAYRCIIGYPLLYTDNYPYDLDAVIHIDDLQDSVIYLQSTNEKSKNILIQWAKSKGLSWTIGENLRSSIHKKSFHLRPVVVSDNPRLLTKGFVHWVDPFHSVR
ncbi:MAG: hypothetical protein KatS3mg054_0022 [Chloroflexus sp.]|nr:MAG: hypothetical protein KatS3mg054_0022 [Chloroflexus sp.]